MSDVDQPLTIKWESDELAKNLAIRTVGLYSFWIKQHSSNNNKENTIQTSQRSSHLFVSVSRFQVMRHRFVSLRARHAENFLDRKFLTTYVSSFWRRKEQNESPWRIRLLCWINAKNVFHVTRILMCIGINDILRVKLTSLAEHQISTFKIEWTEWNFIVMHHYKGNCLEKRQNCILRKVPQSSHLQMQQKKITTKAICTRTCCDLLIYRFSTTSIFLHRQSVYGRRRVSQYLWVEFFFSSELETVIWWNLFWYYSVSIWPYSCLREFFIKKHLWETESVLPTKDLNWMKRDVFDRIPDYFHYQTASWNVLNLFIVKLYIQSRWLTSAVVVVS